MNGLKIEYTIDNFSELISVDDFKELAPKSKVKGVYFLYSIDKELLYIGKSINCFWHHNPPKPNGHLKIIDSFQCLKNYHQW